MGPTQMQKWLIGQEKQLLEEEQKTPLCYAVQGGSIQQAMMMTFHIRKSKCLVD